MAIKYIDQQQINVNSSGHLSTRVENSADIGAGTEYNDGAARGSATGKLMLGDDGTNLQSVKVDTAGELQVDVLTLPATPAGTNAIGKLLPSDVDVTTNTNHVQKYYTSAGAATDGIIWSPAAGKRWHIVSLYINISAAATITLEDDLAAGDNAVWKGELAANSGVVIYFGEEHPLASGEDAADLLITTSAGNVYVTAVGFEI